MKPHIHAALMAEYAKDAAETDQPWRRWESATRGKEFRDMSEHPLWYYDRQYRRKIKTININGFEVPEPMRAEPEIRTYTYIPNISQPNSPSEFSWHPCPPLKDWLESGIIHSTREAAISHAKALLSFTATKP